MTVLGFYPVHLSRFRALKPYGRGPAKHATMRLQVPQGYPAPRFRTRDVFETRLGMPVRIGRHPPTASAFACPSTSSGDRLGFCLPVLRTQAGDSPSKGERCGVKALSQWVRQQRNRRAGYLVIGFRCLHPSETRSQPALPGKIARGAMPPWTPIRRKEVKT